MPNDCWNIITIKATYEQIANILHNEFLEVPEWAFQVVQLGREAMSFKLWSANGPCNEFINRLLDTYNNIWIKNAWEVEDGTMGICVGKKDSLSTFIWNEGPIEEWNYRLQPANFLPPQLNPQQ